MVNEPQRRSPREWTMGICTVMFTKWSTMQNYWGTDTIHRTWNGWLISCYITSIFSDPPHVQHWLLAVWIIRMKAPLLTDMHVTSYATHTRRREAGHTIRQWIGPVQFILDIVNEHATQCNVVWYVFCSPNSSTVVSASLGISRSFFSLSHFEPPPNVVACTRPLPISKAVRVCPHRSCVPSGRVSCGEGRQLTGVCRFKIHSEHTIVQLHSSRTWSEMLNTYMWLLFQVVIPYHCQPVGQILQPSNSYNITWSEICTVSVHCNYLGHSVIWDSE